jgi:hypothetical protein
MLLFNRLVVTTGDMPAIMPLVQEIVSIANGAGNPLQAWAGGNGYVAGSIGFSAAYESLAARAEAGTRLVAAKGLWEVYRKMREHTVSMEPDTILNYVRGGSLGTAIPVGTVVQQNTFQLAQGADFMATLKWANEFADLNKALTGVDGSILYTIYGVLGGVGFLTGYPNMAAVDAARAKMTPEWMAKFLEGSKFGMAGSGMQRTLTKIA